jgi:phosphoglycerate dehydrogenase-like enzyme
VVGCADELELRILPGSDSTKNVLNAERLKQLPNHAWVVNVGRGTSIDDDALLAALAKGEIGGAALDVFQTEPLPVDSPYWKQKDVIVSPHAAGGRGSADCIQSETLSRRAAVEERRISGRANYRFFHTNRSCCVSIGSNETCAE